MSNENLHNVSRANIKLLRAQILELELLECRTSFVEIAEVASTLLAKAKKDLLLWQDKFRETRPLMHFL